jgi:FAD/FMN-containing dehydrogenase
MLRESLKEDVSCITLAPKTLDELANIVSLAYRYHFKVIVRMDEMTKREKIIISEKFVNKCLILNLSSLDRVRIDEENHTVYAETGTTCGIVNSALEERGYAPLFP